MIIGKPNCGHTQLWPIYHYQSSSDKLRLLPNGILRHYFDNQIPDEFELDNEYIEEESKIYHDYEIGKYCLDKVRVPMVLLDMSINNNFRKLMGWKVNSPGFALLITSKSGQPTNF